MEIKLSKVQTITQVEGDAYDLLEEIITEIAGDVQNVPARITLVELEEMGDIVMELQAFKDIMKRGVKAINKVLDKAEEHLCRTIADKVEDLPYRHPKGTITPAARGFFTITDSKALMKSAEIDVDYLLELVRSKKKCSEFFEGILAQGLPLPKGVKSHIIANVKIRKNKDGQEKI